MSKTIDQKVVEMQFDNREFEKNISTSMSSIEKLKQRLNFSGVSKGFDNISTSAKKVDMSALGSAVEAVRVKFSALEVMGVTALANITNSAVNAGKRIVSALTIDPIMTGFQEYETQINAVQTILANTQSKGSTIQDVNAALNELNQYADQTIYNFTEMTKNIGTFTAAGVDLDKSVSSIKGIANLAAVSGSTSQQASTAMYQLSQALAAGKVQLMDWNSVVNAGMGGEVFQTALKRTATQMGTNVDALIEKYGSFRESLTKGEWLTAEVLTETLTQLSGAYTEADLIAQGYTKQQAKDIVDLANTAVSAATDVKTFTQLWDTMKEAAQSGWTQTWEIIVGDFEEAKGLLSELSKTFGNLIESSSSSRNDLLYDTMTSNWKKINDEITQAGLSADTFQDKIITIGKSKGLDMDGIISDYGSLEAAFKNGALSSDLLNDALIKMTGTSEEIGKKLTDLRGEYKTNDDILKALTKAGYEYTDLQDLTTKSVNGQTISLNDLSDAQLMSIGYTAEQVESIRELSEYSELASGSLQKFIDNVAKPTGREMLIDTLRVSLRSLIDIFETVGKAWREVFPPTTSDQLLGVIQSIRDFTLSIRPSEETLGKLQSTFKGLFSILSIGKQAISALLSPLGNLIGKFSGLGGGILDITAALGEWLYALDQSIKAGDSFSVISDGISSAIDFITDRVSSFIDGFDGFGGALSGIGTMISDAFKGAKNIVGEVVDWIRDNISAGDIFAGLAGGGIFILAKKLSGFIEKLKDGFENFFNIFGGGGDGGQFSEVLGSIHDSLESFQQGIQVASLVGIAGAIAILTSSLKTISEIEPAKIAYSLGAISLMIASLNSGFKNLSKTLSKYDAKGTIKASIAMIAIATAINILTTAMEKISKLSLGEIAKGLLGVGGAMAELVVAMKFLDGVKINLRTSIAMLALAEACKILSDALQKFGEMQWDEIARGLVAMGGALAELTVVLSVLSKVGGGGALLGGAAILIAAQSLDEISENLERLGNLSWEQIGKGLAAMGGALAEFGIVLSVLSKVGGGGALLGGAAILIAAQSLDEISENLERLGNLSWEQIGKGLAAMGGALTELGVVSGVLGKLTGFSGLIGAGTILLGVQGLGKLADALKKFGAMAWDEIGRGLVAMGGALTELGVVSGLVGKLTGFSGLVGAGTILLAIQGLGDLADALQKFGSMSWDEIGRGLAAMGGALLELGAITGATGMLTGIAGLVGAGTILLAVQGLGDLADALQKFGSMSWDEIGRGLSAMGAAMGEVALGGLLNTLSGFGAAAIAEIAAPLGDLADSIKKWKDVTVPDNLGNQLGSLASGVFSFNFTGWGADAIAAIAVPIGTMADSIKKWQGVSIPETLGTQLSSLASGVSAFNFAGWGADALAATAPAIGDMAGAIQKWRNVELPTDMGERLKSLADGVGAFSFAFIGGWSISALVDPLTDLASTVSKWNRVTVPPTIDTDLQNLADGVGAFNFSFFSGWSIDGIVEPLANLAESVKKWNGIAISSVGSELTKLATGLNDLGEVSIKDLAKQFDGSSNKIVKSVSGMLDGINSSVNSYKGKIKSGFLAIATESLSALSSKSSQFKTLGSKLIDQLAAGIKSKNTSVNASGKAIINSLLQTIKSQEVNFAKAGTECVFQFVKGIESKRSAISSSFSTDTLLQSIRNQYSSFYSAGSYLGGGFADGLRSQVTAAANAATSIAQSAVTAAKNKLQIKSPSRVGYEIGDYFGLGFVNAVIGYVDQSYKASSEMAGSAVSGLKDTVSNLSRVVEGNLDTQPTIRPVLDLSDIENGTKKLSALFSRDQAVAISASRSRSTVESSQNGVVQTDTAPSTTFVQNNYSPKALSRVEIYRQTNNLLSSYGRKVRA